MASKQLEFDAVISAGQLNKLLTDLKTGAEGAAQAINSALGGTVTKKLVIESSVNAAGQRQYLAVEKERLSVADAINNRIKQEQSTQRGSVTSLRQQLNKATQLRDQTARIVTETDKYGRTVRSVNSAWVEANANVKTIARELQLASAAGQGLFQRAKAGLNVQGLINFSNGINEIVQGFQAASIILGQFAGAINAVVNTAANLQQFGLSFQAIGAGSSGALSSLQEISRISLGLGVSIQTVQDTFQQLSPVVLNSGGTLEDVSAIAESLSSRFAAFGISGDRARRVMNGVIQAFAKGKLQAEELTQQISEADPAFKTDLARAIGVSVQQLEKLVKAGDITSERLIEIIPRLTKSSLLFGRLGQSGEDAANALARGRVTIDQVRNQLSNLNELSLRNLAESAKPAINAFFALQAVITDFFSRLTASGSLDSILALFARLVESVARVTDAVLRLIETATGIVNVFAGAINALAGFPLLFEVIGLAIAGKFLKPLGQITTATQVQTRAVQALLGNIKDAWTGAAAATRPYQKAQEIALNPPRQIGLGRLDIADKLKEAAGTARTSGSAIAQSLTQQRKAALDLEAGLSRVQRRLELLGVRRQIAALPEGTDPRSAERIRLLQREAELKRELRGAPRDGLSARELSNADALIAKQRELRNLRQQGAAAMQPTGRSEAVAAITAERRELEAVANTVRERRIADRVASSEFIKGKQAEIQAIREQLKTVDASTKAGIRRADELRQNLASAQADLGAALTKIRAEEGRRTDIGRVFPQDQAQAYLQTLREQVATERVAASASIKAYKDRLRGIDETIAGLERQQLAITRTGTTGPATRAALSDLARQIKQQEDLRKPLATLIQRETAEIQRSTNKQVTLNSALFQQRAPILAAAQAQEQVAFAIDASRERARELGAGLNETRSKIKQLEDEAKKLNKQLTGEGAPARKRTRELDRQAADIQRQLDAGTGDNRLLTERLNLVSQQREAAERLARSEESAAKSRSRSIQAELTDLRQLEEQQDSAVRAAGKQFQEATRNGREFSKSIKDSEVASKRFGALAPTFLGIGRAASAGFGAAKTAGTAFLGGLKSFASGVLGALGPLGVALVLVSTLQSAFSDATKLSRVEAEKTASALKTLKERNEELGQTLRDLTSGAETGTSEGLQFNRLNAFEAAWKQLGLTVASTWNIVTGKTSSATRETSIDLERYKNLLNKTRGEFQRFGGIELFTGANRKAASEIILLGLSKEARQAAGDFDSVNLQVQEYIMASMEAASGTKGLSDELVKTIADLKKLKQVSDGTTDGQARFASEFKKGEQSLAELEERREELGKRVAQLEDLDASGGLNAKNKTLLRELGTEYVRLSLEVNKTSQDLLRFGIESGALFDKFERGVRSIGGLNARLKEAQDLLSGAIPGTAEFGALAAKAFGIELSQSAAQAAAKNPFVIREGAASEYIATLDKVSKAEAKLRQEQAKPSSDATRRAIASASEELIKLRVQLEELAKAKYIATLDIQINQAQAEAEFARVRGEVQSVDIQLQFKPGPLREALALISGAQSGLASAQAAYAQKVLETTKAVQTGALTQEQAASQLAVAAADFEVKAKSGAASIIDAARQLAKDVAASQGQLSSLVLGKPEFFTEEEIRSEIARIDALFAAETEKRKFTPRITGDTAEERALQKLAFVDTRREADDLRGSIIEMTSALRGFITVLASVYNIDLARIPGLEALPRQIASAEQAVGKFQGRIGEVIGVISQGANQQITFFDTLQGKYATVDKAEFERIRRQDELNKKIKEGADAALALPAQEPTFDLSGAVQAAQETATSLGVAATSGNQLSSAVEQISPSMQAASSAAGEMSSSFSNAADSADRMVQAIRSLAGLRVPVNVGQPARWTGGPVSGGTAYRVNELGQEGFLSASGALSAIRKPRNGLWRAPSSGTVIPAHIWSGLDIPANGVKVNPRGLPSPAGSSGMQRLTRAIQAGLRVQVTQPSGMEELAAVQAHQAQQIGKLSRAVSDLAHKDWNVNVGIRSRDDTTYLRALNSRL